MTKKTFYIDLNKQNFNDIQILNKELLFKSFVRSTLKNKEEVKILDDNSILSSIYLKEDAKVGKFLSNKRFILKNKFNNELRLNAFLSQKNFNSSIVSEYKNTLLSLLKTRNFNRKEPVIILGSNKGGFYVYYSGIYGFLPRSQYWLVWKSVLKTNSKQNLLEMLELRKIFPIRLPLKITKVTTCITNKHNNFSRSKRTRIFVNSMNVVFIFKKMNFWKNRTKNNKGKSVQLHIKPAIKKVNFWKGGTENSKKESTRLHIKPTANRVKILHNRVQTNKNKIRKRLKKDFFNNKDFKSDF